MNTVSPDKPPIIQLDSVCLTLMSGAGAVNILRGIDLSVPAGQAVGLVGPSGSGKSSLMAIIAGLEQVTAGGVTIAGHDITNMDEDGLARFRRHHVGIVFQSFHLIPTMTALENVAAPLELAGRADAFGRAAAELAAVGLDRRLGHYPGQLSGGEQQRVALARAMVPRPSLLLADEPTGNLDGATGAEVIDLMFALHDERGTSFLLITHDAGLAGRCDRVLDLSDGKLVGDRATGG